VQKKNSEIHGHLRTWRWNFLAFGIHFGNFGIHFGNFGIHFGNFGIHFGTPPVFSAKSLAEPRYCFSFW
jgi:hypothetical protein